MLPARCHWCGVPLRWWQVLRGVCRFCYLALSLNTANAPYPEKSRWDESPDGEERHAAR